MRKILVMVDLIIFCLFAASFYGIILHFPSVSLAGPCFAKSLSSQRELYWITHWITPVAPLAHLSTVNDGNTERTVTSLCREGLRGRDNVG